MVGRAIFRCRPWKGLSVLAVAAAAMLLASPAAADYRFQVPENRVRVEIRPDASLAIQYAITFANEGQPIDIIDVGLPDRHYTVGRADLDGVTMTDIRPSEYLDAGVEVHLGDHAIPAGSSGTLHLEAVAQDRVFGDREDPAYASMEFSPTWYGAQFTSGSTHLVCEFVFPEGVGPDDPRFHGTAFNSARVENGRVIYRWEIPDASPSGQYTFGASFPRRVMQKVLEEPKGPGPLAKILGGLVQMVTSSLPCCVFLGFFAMVIIGVVKGSRRKLQYLPASVGVEGVEVRRGLTVPEAAALMEQPVDRVLTLLMFGMIRKGSLKVVGRNPLKLELVPGVAPEQTYEKAFADAVQDDGRVSEREAAKVLSDLIERVRDKMKGYSRKKSVLYYQDIMRRAWDRVGKEDYAQAFEWLLLDKNFGATANQRLGGRPVPVPGWWVPMTVGHSRGPISSAPAGTGFDGVVAGANSVVSGLESFSHDLVSSVPGLATKVTEKTNPVPKSSGGGHSGGGCACACACAGCACACAGGGR